MIEKSIKINSFCQKVPYIGQCVVVLLEGIERDGGMWWQQVKWGSDSIIIRKYKDYKKTKTAYYYKPYDFMLPQRITYWTKFINLTSKDTRFPNHANIDLKFERTERGLNQKIDWDAPLVGKNAL